MDRRHVIAVAQRGRGPDRDRLVPVPGIQRTEQIAALVHRDHAVLDRSGQHHHLVDAYAAPPDRGRTARHPLTAVWIRSRSPSFCRLSLREELEQAAVEVGVSLDHRPVSAVRIDGQIGIVDELFQLQRRLQWDHLVLAAVNDQRSVRKLVGCLPPACTSPRPSAGAERETSTRTLPGTPAECCPRNAPGRARRSPARVNRRTRRAPCACSRRTPRTPTPARGPR